MPYSMNEGKDWMRERIVADTPDTVLDIGPGCGTYATLLRPWLPEATLSCVEIFAPYVERFGLSQLYDEVIVGDVRQADLPECDVIILGDVLEHMSLDEALVLWDRVRSAARRSVYLSIPIIEYAQGEWEGNPHEAHLHTWSDAAVRSSLSGITEHAAFSVLGVYRASGK